MHECREATARALYFMLPLICKCDFERPVFHLVHLFCCCVHSSIALRCFHCCSSNLHVRCSDLVFMSGMLHEVEMILARDAHVVSQTQGSWRVE